MIEVAVVDDDTVIRDGLPHLLPDCVFTGRFDSVASLLAAMPPARVVLLDLSLTGGGARPGIQGGAAVRAVSDAGYRVLIYTNDTRREVLAGCLSRGARGVVGKAEPMNALENAIVAVATERIVITQAMIGLVEIAERQGLIGRLTPRQREVLSARARGESFLSIGERLAISVRTAEDHWSQITAKFADYLGEHSAADLERHLGIGPGDLLDEDPSPGRPRQLGRTGINSRPRRPPQ